MRRAILGLALLAACSSQKTSDSTQTPTPTDKGTSMGTPTTTTLGASGGAVSSPDGRFTLTVPAGALASDVAISVEPITNTAPLGIGTAYRLTPEGTAFSSSATVTFKLASSDLAGSSLEAARIGYQSADGLWHEFGNSSVDGTAMTVSVPTRHFSDWSMLYGWQLRPPEARIATGDSLNLQLKYCEPESSAGPAGGDELSSLRPRCDLDLEFPPLVDVHDWSVNGIKGGSLGEGLVTSNGANGAVYQAPIAEPAHNPVAVSCEISTPGMGSVQVVSNVNVGGSGWSGTVSWSMTGNKSTAEGMYMKTYTVTGSGELVIRPGAEEGTVTVDSASASYDETYDEQYNNSYTAGGCMHVVNQHTTQHLSGETTNVADVVVEVVVDPNNTASILFNVPSAQTLGHVKVDATEVVTGPPASCQSPHDNHTDDPLTGQMPADAMLVTLMNAPPKLLAGTATLHFDGLPPRDYVVTYSLTQ